MFCLMPKYSRLHYWQHTQLYTVVHKVRPFLARDENYVLWNVYCKCAFFYLLYIVCILSVFLLLWRLKVFISAAFLSCGVWLGAWVPVTFVYCVATATDIRPQLLWSANRNCNPVPKLSNGTILNDLEWPLTSVTIFFNIQ